MFWRGHLVTSMKNESEGDKSGVCSLLCTWVCRFPQDACQQLGAVAMNLDLVQLSCQDFRSQASPPYQMRSWGLPP